MGISLKKLFENWDKRLETETLDEFRGHLETSLRRRQKHLEEEYSGLTEDQFEDPRDIEGYRMHLSDLISEVGAVQYLADELSIVALYKQVELHLKRVIAKNFPSINEKKLSDIEFVKKTILFDIEALTDFPAYDELRLINNAIKHQGKVTKPLGDKFPVWKEGEELKELGVAYSRLLPLTKNYVQHFVSMAYANSQKFKP